VSQITDGQPQAPASTSTAVVPAASTTAPTSPAFTGAASNNKPAVAFVGGVIALLALA